MGGKEENGEKGKNRQDRLKQGRKKEFSGLITKHRKGKPDAFDYRT